MCSYRDIVKAGINVGGRNRKMDIIMLTGLWPETGKGRKDEIPLDNRELDDHKCCILSFLLMLAPLIIYSWFTHSMKKRQKKLAELKDRLAEETLKRRFGIADTKESAR